MLRKNPLWKIDADDFGYGERGEDYGGTEDHEDNVRKKRPEEQEPGEQ